MLPVIALVGRPNVGKSTLFNRLTKTRDALVADQPGLTRDRRYGRAKIGKRHFLLVDTGGLSGNETGIDQHMAQQTHLAIEEADAVCLLADAKDGLNTADYSVIDGLRRLNKPVVLLINKTDGLDPDTACADFHSIGLGQPLPISAAHGRGIPQAIQALTNTLDAHYPGRFDGRYDNEDNPQSTKGVRIAVLGRPNVGKSTLVNRLVGEQRVITYDQPGTTRDSVFVPFERNGEPFTLIDTAGIRRRARVKEAVEKFSVIKALQAIEQSQVVIVVLDGSEGMADQDAHLIGHAINAGRGLVLAINKWDGLDPDQRQQTRRSLDLRTPFLEYADVHYISALHGTAVGDVMDSVIRAHKNAYREFATSELTRILEGAVTEHPPKLVRGRRIKLRYAHQGGKNPPIIVIHGNQVDAVPDTYKRYLANKFRQKLKLRGTPLKIQFKAHDNPYEGRKNKLSGRQINKRKRLMKFVQRKR